MPQIEPIAEAKLSHHLAEAIQHGLDTNMLSSTIPVRIWAHRPNLADAWLAMLNQMHNHGILPARVRELVRLKIASITECKACNIARKCDDVSEEDIFCLSTDISRFSGSEQAALVYAESFTGDYFNLDDEIWNRLREYYSEAEIVELGLFCALMLAGGRFTYVINGYEPDNSI